MIYKYKLLVNIIVLQKTLPYMKKKIWESNIKYWVKFEEVFILEFIH